MVLVDSSVWIDYFNNKKNDQADWLDSALGNVAIILGDLILVEVLQGFSQDRDFLEAKKIMSLFPCYHMGGSVIAMESVQNYRLLRKKGVTVRKTIDVIIGSFCIHYNIPLIHNDRDFNVMEEYLGLQKVNL